MLTLDKLPWRDAEASLKVAFLAAPHATTLTVIFHEDCGFYGIYHDRCSSTHEAAFLSGDERLIKKWNRVSATVAQCVVFSILYPQDDIDASSVDTRPLAPAV